MPAAPSKPALATPPQLPAIPGVNDQLADYLRRRYGLGMA